jgi:hypothetical protein
MILYGQKFWNSENFSLIFLINFMNYKFCAQIFQIVIVIVIVIAFMVRWEVLGIWKAYPLSGTATHILS